VPGSPPGVGTITGTPDVVTVVLGVQTQGPSAGRPGREHPAATGDQHAEEQGVADADLQTSELS